MTTTTEAKAFQSFADFYPYYLSEHANRTCRRLHFVGTSLGTACLVTLLVTRDWWWFPIGLLVGYAFAWTGHFFFEKNRPATFKRPFYSFMGDYVMYKDIWTGKIPF
ncbi:Mpo1-like protein [Ramlibacter albus]|uniref:DUF962 domain-containing protein n=1 Tax=Ramlibacter albus TaxID=2079448 RepID=A0A923MDB5_9BURK|nr:Mpo1-like protein [Ramlibacter albus]MBC5766952.1 DUF962 domain-containing protein [Ramlibacter albus]